MKKHCEKCGEPMQRWGHTKAGTPRFFCDACKKSNTWKRKDVVQRNIRRELDSWLGGKESLSEIARGYHKTRQALWKEFHPFFTTSVFEPHIPSMTKTKVLILDATYVHSHSLCALVAIDENDKLYWRFAPYESYKFWLHFMSNFAEPEIVIMDGQKGLFAAAKTLWPKVAVQRCQFHVIAFAIQYLGRQPKEVWGKNLLEILYDLKNAKTYVTRDLWIASYQKWENKYEYILASKNQYGKFNYPRLRSTRLIIRRALPYIFTFLDHSGAPNTTNLVEGWVNGAVAEALRRHRGLRIGEKKALVSVVLSHLKRQKKQPKDTKIGLGIEV